MTDLIMLKKMPRLFNLCSSFITCISQLVEPNVRLRSYMYHIGFCLSDFQKFSYGRQWFAGRSDIILFENYSCSVCRAFYIASCLETPSSRGGAGLVGLELKTPSAFS